MKTVEVLGLDGNPRTIPALGQVTVLVFFGPHCASCEKLLADLDQYWRRFDHTQVSVIGVVLDTDRESAIQLKRKKKVGFPWTISNVDTLSDLYGVRAIPSAFVIDKQGIVTMYADGASGDGERILRQVRALLEI